MKSDKLYIVDSRIVAARRDQLDWVQRGSFTFLELLPEHLVTQEMLADERLKDDQAQLDATWAMFDAAVKGDKQAIEWVGIRRAFGAKMPETRTAKRRMDVVSVAQYYFPDGRVLTSCRHCDALMVRTDRDRKHRHRYCSNTCADNEREELRGLREPYDRSRPKVKGVCPQCSTEFVKARIDAVFCSPKCRVAAHRAKPDKGNPDADLVLYQQAVEAMDALR